MSNITCEAPGCDRVSRGTFKGGDVRVCNLHYLRLLKHGSFDLPERVKKDHSHCTVDGCENLSRTVGGALCEMHYGRRYRRGTTSEPIYGRTFVASHGYVISYSPGHPVATKSGVLYEHRRRLFDLIGGGSHPCHWCKDDVSWDVGKGPQKLVVDHLDNDKENNETTNLVPSCHSCNTSRGLFANWVMKHRDDPFLIKLFEAANDNKPRIVCDAA